jgi:hypothetical protein
LNAINFTSVLKTGILNPRINPLPSRVRHTNTLVPGGNRTVCAESIKELHREVGARFGKELV